MKNLKPRIRIRHSKFQIRLNDADPCRSGYATLGNTIFIYFNTSSLHMRVDSKLVV
jgi:hypothetical protein